MNKKKGEIKKNITTKLSISEFKILILSKFLGKRNILEPFNSVSSFVSIEYLRSYLETSNLIIKC